MSPQSDLDSFVSSLDSDLDSRSSNESQRFKNVPLTAHGSEPENAPNTNILRSRSTASTTVSMASSVSRRVSRNVRLLVDQVRDDNNQTEVETIHRRRTKEGREREYLGLEDAIRIATSKSAAGDQFLGEEEHDKEEDEDNVEEDEGGAQTKIPPPDKGYAWVVCFSEFLVLFSTWGANGAYGVFLNYWMNHQTFSGATATDYALIGGLVLFVAQAAAPLVQMISAILGMKETMAIGIVLQTAGYALGSVDVSLWQLYLTQGALVGFGFAFIFNPAIVCLPEWFDKKRGLSSGVVVSASGVGGVIFALASQRLIVTTGSYKWAMRMIAIVSFCCAVVLTILVRQRIKKPRLRTWHEIKVRANILFNFKVFKHLDIYFLALWFSLITACYVTALFSLSAYCTSIGLTSEQGSHVTAIFNGCQAVGRATIGLSADYVGRVNLSVSLTLGIVILVFAMWINALTYAVVLGYAVLAGLIFGVAATLNQPILADMLPPELFPSGWSFENFLTGSFCLFCEVVALKLRNHTGSKRFIRAQILSGCFAIGGFLLITIVREFKVRRMINERLEVTEDSLSMVNNPSLPDEEKVGSDVELLTKRQAAYKLLLAGGVRGYLSRMFYPIIA